MGEFTKRAKPEIIINGKVIEINDEGYCVYKKKVNSSPGKYSIPVKISFTDDFGKRQTIQKDVEYNVAKECN